MITIDSILAPTDTEFVKRRRILFPATPCPIITIFIMTFYFASAAAETKKHRKKHLKNALLTVSVEKNNRIMSLGSSGRPFSPNKPPSSPIGRAVEIYDTSQRESDQSYQVPIIGLGSFVTGDKPETMRDELLKFFQFGGRLIEISELFSNYHLLNQILQECQLSRQDIYIVYKVWPKDVSPEQLLEKIHQFINASCWEYIDILLVHAPIDVANRFEQWKALETLKKQNLVKIIGNSNLSINELMTVMKNSEILPSIHSVSNLN